MHIHVPITRLANEIPMFANRQINLALNNGTSYLLMYQSLLITYYTKHIVALSSLHLFCSQIFRSGGRWLFQDSFAPLFKVSQRVNCGLVLLILAGLFYISENMTGMKRLTHLCSTWFFYAPAVQLGLIYKQSLGSPKQRAEIHKLT